jgi:predicted ATPase
VPKSKRRAHSRVFAEVTLLIPNALLFTRYRAFRDSARLELSPLTVVIGKNGGGKSVLTRLPLIVASGLDPEAEAPIDLGAGGIYHGTRYEDLIYQRSAQPFSLGAEISHDERRIQFITTLRHVVERHSLGIEAFELSESGQRIVSLRAASPEDIGNPEGSFLAKFGQDPNEQTIRAEIVGLFPVFIEGHVHITDEIQSRRSLFESAFSGPSYLGPFRTEAGSLPRIPRQGVRDLGPRGERALDIVGNDALRGNGELVQAVEDWFGSAMGGSRVTLERAGDLPRILIHDPIRSIDVDLADTGAGFAQVFPVVVQALARRMGRILSPIIIVEQPELHLHPAAHGDVADLICDTVAATGGEVRYICETHSEQFITRLRRRIAEGKFPKEMVTVASVGHQGDVGDEPEALRLIALDDFGNPDAWPVGVFSEAFDDLVQMKAAARRRAGAEPGPGQ